MRKLRQAPRENQEELSPEWSGLDPNVEVEDPAKFIEELLNEDIATSLLQRGYAVFRLNEETKKVYSDFAVSLAMFCHQPLEEKAKYATLMESSNNSVFTPNQFHGYSRMEGLKEQFALMVLVAN